MTLILHPALLETPVSQAGNRAGKTLQAPVSKTEVREGVCWESPGQHRGSAWGRRGFLERDPQKRNRTSPGTETGKERHVGKRVQYHGQRGGKNGK